MGLITEIISHNGVQVHALLCIGERVIGAEKALVLKLGGKMERKDSEMLL